jgi:cyclic pyranopterin phosphate synthase
MNNDSAGIASAKSASKQREETGDCFGKSVASGVLRDLAERQLREERPRNDGWRFDFGFRYSLGYNLHMPVKLTHLDESGRARMVDVSAKPDTDRVAVAKGEVLMKKETLDLIRAGQIKKGDVLTVAQIAGITAAKRTSDLIPLCHPLPLTKVDVDLALDDSLPGVSITATAKVTGKTGVEMEALTAVSVAALTVYDMAKAAEKTMRIQNIRVVEKHGGRSGDVVNE